MRGRWCAQGRRARRLQQHPRALPSVPSEAGSCGAGGWRAFVLPLGAGRSISCSVTGVGHAAAAPRPDVLGFPLAEAQQRQERSGCSGDSRDPSWGTAWGVPSLCRGAEMWDGACPSYVVSRHAAKPGEGSLAPFHSQGAGWGFVQPARRHQLSWGVFQHPLISPAGDSGLLH